MKDEHKRDLVASTWIDSRELTTVIKFLMKRGYIPVSVSDSISTGISCLAEIIHNSGEVEPTETTSEARSFLSETIRQTDSMRKRGMRNIIHNLQLDSMIGSQPFDSNITREETPKAEIPDAVRNMAIKEEKE